MADTTKITIDPDFEDYPVVAIVRADAPSTFESDRRYVVPTELVEAYESARAEVEKCQNSILLAAGFTRRNEDDWRAPPKDGD